MSMEDTATLIQRRYENNNHFYYPEMEKLLDDVIQDPNITITIPDDFTGKSLQKTNFLISIIQQIKIIFQKIITNLKYFFSTTFRNNYKLAVKKIKEAHIKKVETIGKVSNALKCNKEVIEQTKPQLVTLKGRIKLLEAEIVQEKATLEEKIDAKNLIVDQAKALKVKRETEPTGFQKIENEARRLENEANAFFRNLFRMEARVQEKQVEKEVEEIAALDPAFPTTELTDDNITAYETENFESPVIQDIKARKVTLIQKSELLEEAKAALEQVRTILKSAVDNITKATQEIETLNLENFFEDADLEIPDISEEPVEVVAKVLTPKELQLQKINQDIEKLANKDLATLMTTLLKRFPEDAITSWQCDAEGNYTLQLKNTYKIWMPGNDPVGGAVNIFGFNTNGEVKGKLEKDNLYFTSGVVSYVRVPVFGYIKPSFDGIQYHDRTDIRIGGTYLGQTAWKQKNFSQTKKDWEKNAVVIDDNYEGGYEKFLEEKVNGVK